MTDIPYVGERLTVDFKLRAGVSACEAGAPIYHVVQEFKKAGCNVKMNGESDCGLIVVDHSKPDQTNRNIDQALALLKRNGSEIIESVTVIGPMRYHNFDISLPTRAVA